MATLSSVVSLADYKYYDMHVTVERALDVWWEKKRTREYIKTSRIKGRKGEILSGRIHFP